MAATDRDARRAALFHLVADLPAEERRSALLRHCSDDSTLRQEVEELVREDERGPAPVLRGTALRPATSEEHRVGPFRLLEVLGEGGMGIVYLAEQEEPVQRRVALKMIRFGMHTEEVATRFERERAALARMKHPGIAEIYASGVSESGRPYFAMEYVAGTPITESCDSARLPIEQRLGLFRQVCEAVQHAHQKGILHRDLKPSNALVTHEDGRPRAKIIDFGIAAALSGGLGSDAYHTTLGRVVGTYLYMSPEQAGAEPDIDTRTDVYSLGVLLYELLVGVSPYPESARAAGDPASLQRAVLEHAPLPPSRRVLALGSAAEPLAALRRQGAPALARHLRRDLDWIVAKALEKDRERRYASAAELAADLERHLADRPVLAGPPSTTYRMGRFLHRHRVLVTAAALVAVALLVALGASLAAWSSSERALVLERARARESTRRVERLAAKIDFFEHALFDAPPGSESRAAIESLLDFAVVDVPALFGAHLEREAAVRRAAGNAYLLLDVPRKAQRELLRAYALQSRLSPEGDLELFLTLESLIRATRLTEGIDAAAPYVERSLALARTLSSGAPELQEALVALDAARADGIGAIEARLGELALLLARNHEETPSALFLGRALVEAGLARLEAGEVQEGELLFDRLEALGASVLTPSPRARLLFLRRFADGYLRTRPPLAGRALRLAGELRTLAQEILPPEHWIHAESLRLEGLALAELGPDGFAAAERDLLEAEARAVAPAEATRGLEALARRLVETGRLDAFLSGSWERWRRGPREVPWWPASEPGLPPEVRGHVEAFLEARAAGSGGDEVARGLVRALAGQ